MLNGRSQIRPFNTEGGLLARDVEWNACNTAGTLSMKSVHVDNMHSISDTLFDIYFKDVVNAEW